MHEFSLYGQVPKDEHHRLLQQFAGLTRMQPRSVAEIHLVFKARPPSGLDNIPSAGGSQGVMQQDVQKMKNMLNAGLYYVQLVGALTSGPTGNRERPDVAMADSDQERDAEKPSVQWFLEFKDTPDPGKQPVSARLVSRTPLDAGDLVMFLEHFGYEYVSRFVVIGSKFYDQDTTLFVHKVLRLPQVDAERAIKDDSFLSKISDLPELDGSGGYLVQTSVDVIDGNNPELKDRATRQLLTLKDTLKPAVDLTPGDRLALDTRLPVTSRRS